MPQAFLEPVPDPLGDLVARYARTHVPFHATEVARAYGLGPAVATAALARLVSSGRVVEGELLPTGGGGTEFCDAEVLRMLRRRSLAALRAEVEPVTPVELSRFLQGWQGVGGRLRGRDGLVRVVEQLSGAVLPASAIESLVLPTRVADYSPALLDELMSTGEVLWCGHGSLPGDDGWVSLHLADSAHVTLPGPDPDRVPSADGLAVLDALAGGGAHFFRTLSDQVGSSDDAGLATTLWDLAWSGRVTGDTFAPVRALLSGGRTAHKRSTSGPRRTRYAGRRGPLGGLGAAPTRPTLPARTGPPQVTGRWSLLPPVDLDPTLRAYATAELLLDRHGILTRGATAAEDVPGGFAAIYRVLGRGRGGRAGAPRLLRRGARRLAVRHHRRRRPAAQRPGVRQRRRRPRPGRTDRRRARVQRPGQPVRRGPGVARPRGRPRRGRRRRRRSLRQAPSPPARPQGRRRRACSSTATSCSTSSGVARRC